MQTHKEAKSLHMPWEKENGIPRQGCITTSSLLEMCDVSRVSLP